MNEGTEHKYKLPEKPEGQGFKVPDGYFEGLGERVLEKVRAGEREKGGRGEGMKGRRDEGEKRSARTVWMRVRPQLSLAAAIVGFALISFTVIRLLTGPVNIDTPYDLAFLDESGILDESVFMEALEENDEFADEYYSDWEMDAMNYLASNGVNLETLLNEN